MFLFPLAILCCEKISDDLNTNCDVLGMEQKLQFRIKSLLKEGSYTVADVLEAIKSEKLCKLISYVRIGESSHPNYATGIAVLSYPTPKAITILKKNKPIKIPFLSSQPLPFELIFLSASTADLLLESKQLELGLFVEQNVFMPRTTLLDGILLFDFIKRKEIMFFFTIGSKYYKLCYM